MVLAAGLGQRMRPLTNDKPKALVVLQGQTLLDRALVKCREADVDTLVVNTHYKGEMIVHHVRGMTDVTVSEEEDLLETGGGVANALPLLGARILRRQLRFRLDGQQKARAAANDSKLARYRNGRAAVIATGRPRGRL